MAQTIRENASVIGGSYASRRPRSSLLFCTTNGAGLGHLTRAIAVARSITQFEPDLPIAFLTSTAELSIVKREGFPTYYVPPYFLDLEKVIGWEQWQAFVCTNALAIFENHKVGTVVFDGYIPFPGLVTALGKREDINRIWIRRGMEKAAHRSVPDRMEDKFQYIIRPVEAGVDPGPPDGRSFPVDPILGFEMSSLKDRGAARAELGVPPNALAVYVQLGSGVRVSNVLALAETVQALNECPSIYVVLGMSVLSQAEAPRVAHGRIVRSYPNFPILSAFDFAISAAGYNTVHELLACRIPTIHVPRESEEDSEDQLERALRIERAGAGIVVRSVDGRSAFRRDISVAIQRMGDPGVRAAMSAAAARVFTSSGAASAAQFIAGVHRSGDAPGA